MDINVDLRDMVEPDKLEEVNEQVAASMRYQQKIESHFEVLLYLRDHGVPFEDVLAIAKKLGEKMKTTDKVKVV